MRNRARARDKSDLDVRVRMDRDDDDRRDRGKRSPGETYVEKRIYSRANAREPFLMIVYRACTRSCGRPAITLLIEILLPTLAGITTS